jgi:hypothetical protein
LRGKPAIPSKPPIGFLLFALLLSSATASAQSVHISRQGQTIACRVLEVEESAQYGVRLVIFHYRDESDRAKLGAFLRKDNGATVSFELPGGKWRAATVLRLRVCFGRGLLVFPLSRPRRHPARHPAAQGAALARGDVILVRFA